MKTLQGGNATIGNWGDVGGDFCTPFSDLRNALVLAENVAQSFTVPVGATKVFFQVSISWVALWVDNLRTAVIPTGAITNGTAPELNPYGKQVAAGDVLSVICDQACVVVAVYYK